MYTAKQAASTRPRLSAQRGEVDVSARDIVLPSESSPTRLSGQ